MPGNQPYGIVYKATSPDGKVYIGQTVKSLARRKNDHSYRAKKGDQRGAFQLALLEHGFSAFTWEQIDTAETKEELDAKEKHWIAHYNSMDPGKGYNLTIGGRIFTPSLETRLKISKAHYGMKYRNGEKASIEVRKRMSESHKNSIAVKGHINSLAAKSRGVPQPKVWGEKCGKATIDTDIATKIKLDLKKGAKNCDIARKHNVSKMIVTQIKTGRTWAWLKI